jgi:hypothetical protein
VERKLAAILAADMVGYSRLMEADEVGTGPNPQRPNRAQSRLNRFPTWTWLLIVSGSGRERQLVSCLD